MKTNGSVKDVFINLDFHNKGPSEHVTRVYCVDVCHEWAEVRPHRVCQIMWRAFSHLLVHCGHSSSESVDRHELLLYNNPGLVPVVSVFLTVPYN